MRPLIVYYSRTGNTAPLARTVAKTIAADCMHAEEVRDSDLAGRELIGLATGTYNSRPARQILQLIPRIAPGTRVFTLITSGFTASFLVRWYFSRFRKPLARQGLCWIGKWNCPGHDKYPPLRWANIQAGRPNAADAQSACEFAQAMLNTRM